MEVVIVDIKNLIAYIILLESAMSFFDSSRPHPRSVLWLFYSSAFLSAIMFSVASYAPLSYYKPLLALALVTALAAVFFLVLFLRSKDERERPINYRALTFAFVGTLVFSLVVGLAQHLGFHFVSWLGLPALMISLWSFGLILHSWRYR
jgi:heme/copper-type cytochrome/quinol oxidase subunit 4